MSGLLLALALAIVQAPETPPVEPPPMPRGPRQPATGAAPPELMPGPRFCTPRAGPEGQSHNFESCFATYDYPLAAYDARQQGITTVRVEVGPWGRATGCTVTASSGSALLDEAACTLLERRISISIPYNPGVEPKASTLTGRVAWVLPDTSPRDIPATHSSYFMMDDYPAAALRANEQGIVMFTLRISAAGRATGCEINRSSGSQWLDLATCRILRSRARYHPARDADGRPVPGVDRGVIAWRIPEE